MGEKKLCLFKTLKESCSFFNNHFPLLISLFSPFYLSSLGLGGVFYLYKKKGPPYGLLFWERMWWEGILPLLIFLILLWGSITLLLALKSLERKEKISFKIYSEATAFLLPLLMIFFTESLIVVGSFILLVFPAFLLFFWYTFTPHALTIHKKRKTEALLLSKYTVRTSPFMVLKGLLLTLILVGSITYLFMHPLLHKWFSSPLAKILWGILAGLSLLLTLIWLHIFSFHLYQELIRSNPRIPLIFEMEKE